MLLMSAALLLGMQTVPATAVRLVIPSGRCRAELDGKAVAIGALPAAINAWGQTNPQVEFKPDPGAAYECVDQVLGILKAAKVPMQLGFVGNEAFAPEKPK